MTDWNVIAETLREKMQGREPVLKVRDVAKWLNLSSTSTADYYLWKLEEMGVVKRIENGGKGEWFLKW